MNRFEFLKNYKDFACLVRYRTATVLLANLKSSQDQEDKKVMMLRIIEDLVASTEDLAMWLITINDRNKTDKKFRDEWERLLIRRIETEESKKILQTYKRIKSVKGFLRKMDFPNVNRLSSKLNVTKSIVINAVEKIRHTVETAVKQREDNRGMVDRAHNKIKHGMMVYSDPSKDSAWVRDFSAKLAGVSRRVSRKNRSIDIRVDIPKAERIVGTIKANAQAIEALINLLLIDYEYRIKFGKIRMRKAKKEKSLDEITKALN